MWGKYCLDITQLLVENIGILADSPHVPIHFGRVSLQLPLSRVLSLYFPLHSAYRPIHSLRNVGAQKVFLFSSTARSQTHGSALTAPSCGFLVSEERGRNLSLFTGTILGFPAGTKTEQENPTMIASLMAEIGD